MWPWLIGGVVLAGVIIGLVYASRSDAAGDEREKQQQAEAEAARRMAQQLARPVRRGRELVAWLREHARKRPGS